MPLTINCPVSSKPIKDPVIIHHPNFAPIIYERASVIECVNNGYLERFGITPTSYRNFIIPMQLLRGLMEYMESHNGILYLNRNEQGEIELDELDEIYKDPYSQGFPFKNEELICFVRTDGHSFLSSIINQEILQRRTSIYNYPIKPEQDIYIDPIAEKLATAVASAINQPEGKNSVTIDLNAVFNDFRLVELKPYMPARKIDGLEKYRQTLNRNKTPLAMCVSLIGLSRLLFMPVGINLPILGFVILAYYFNLRKVRQSLEFMALYREQPDRERPFNLQAAIPFQLLFFCLNTQEAMIQSQKYFFLISPTIAMPVALLLAFGMLFSNIGHEWLKNYDYVEIIRQNLFKKKVRALVNYYRSPHTKKKDKFSHAVNGVGIIFLFNFLFINQFFIRFPYQFFYYSDPRINNSISNILIGCFALISLIDFAGKGLLTTIYFATPAEERMNYDDIQDKWHLPLRLLFALLVFYVSYSMFGDHLGNAVSDAMQLFIFTYLPEVTKSYLPVTSLFRLKTDMLTTRTESNEYWLENDLLRRRV